MNTIQLKLLENKLIAAYVNGYDYTYEGGYNIVAGEVNATEFEISSVPDQYKEATFYLELKNSKKQIVNPPSIINNKFILPSEMAIPGYGQIVIKAKYFNTSYENYESVEGYLISNKNFQLNIMGDDSPAIPEINKIYKDKFSGENYVWNGNNYVNISTFEETVVWRPLKIKIWNDDIISGEGSGGSSSGGSTPGGTPGGDNHPVTSVNGKTGDVVLTKHDIGLTQVKNVDTTDPNNILSYKDETKSLTDDLKELTYNIENFKDLYVNKLGDIMTGTLQINTIDSPDSPALTITNGENEIRLSYSNEARDESNFGLLFSSNTDNNLYIDAPKIYENGERVYSLNNEPRFRMSVGNQVEKDKLRDLDYILEEK